MAYFAMDDLEMAANVLARALERDRGAIELAPSLAATYAQLGRREEAFAALQLWKPGTSPDELRAFPPPYHFPYQWSEDREILARIGDGLRIAALPLETTVRTLAVALMREGTTDRVRGANLLGRFGPAAVEAVPALISALADEEDNVKVQAAIALGKIGPAAEAAIPALTALKDSPSIGWRAKKTLEKIAGN
jgi:tetratricopeptide (TPR) repeat protein